GTVEPERRAGSLQVEPAALVGIVKPDALDADLLAECVCRRRRGGLGRGRILGRCRLGSKACGQEQENGGQSHLVAISEHLPGGCTRGRPTAKRRMMKGRVS